MSTLISLFAPLSPEPLPLLPPAAAAAVFFFAAVAFFNDTNSVTIPSIAYSERSVSFSTNTHTSFDASFPVFFFFFVFLPWLLLLLLLLLLWRCMLGGGLTTCAAPAAHFDRFHSKSPCCPPARSAISVA